MTETLIMFETAKLAKEKGFDEEGIEIYPISHFDEHLKTHTRHSKYVKNSETDHILAPTQSLLQKWLREVHRTDTTVITDWTKGGRVYYVGFSFVNPNNEIDIWFSNDNENRKVKYLSYEGALEIGLQEALKLIQP